jgi:hypothetical protein
MKSPTDELLDLCPELNAESPRSGFTGGFDLYDELIGFTAPPPDAPSQAAGPDEAEGALLRPAAAPSTDVAKAASDSGALSQSEDVIRVTGALAGFVASRMAAATGVCGDCGNSSDGGEMFCIHCGGLLDASSAEAAVALAGPCDDCGAVVESDEIFCPSCGSVMATA